MDADPAFPADHETRMVVAAAHLRGDPGDAVSTDDLIVGLATVGSAAAALDAADLTAVAARAVSRRRRGTWASDDGPTTGDPGATKLVIVEGGAPAAVTPAAGSALRRAATAAGTAGRPNCTPTDVLLALLDTPGSRALEMLDLCGVDVLALGRSLLSGKTAAAADRVEPDLRRLRDVLLGRARYRSRGWRDRLLSAGARSAGYANRPALWAALEAKELAAEAGRRRPATDDLLLAVLAIHEVTGRYPHLAAGTEDDHDGGRLLADAGLRYRDALRIARDTDLGADPLPLKAYVPTLPDDTAGLLRRILDGTGNRASRLLEHARIDVTRLAIQD